MSEKMQKFLYACSNNSTYNSIMELFPLKEIVKEIKEFYFNFLIRNNFEIEEIKLPINAIHIDKVVIVIYEENIKYKNSLFKLFFPTLNIKQL